MRLAYLFAIESDRVRADGIEVTGFADLVRQHRISSVPLTVLGGGVGFVGVCSEAMLLQHVQEASRRGGAIAAP